MSDIAARSLLTTSSVLIRDLECSGGCRRPGAEECTAATHLVFPYRGMYVRHVGRDEGVAEANQAFFFNAGEAYRVSHPLGGGDASLDLTLDEPLLRELASPVLLRTGSPLAFKQQRLRIDPATQMLVALVRHRLSRRLSDSLEAESLALALARRALGPRTSHVPGAGAAGRRLVNRAKVVLSSDLTRRWTLGEVAAAVGYSPVYLTQVFQQVEGVPLYRYHLRLRLARALDLLFEYDDLTTLGLDLGFSSHSHFTTAFRRMYGRSPSQFRAAALRHRRTAGH